MKILFIGDGDHNHPSTRIRMLQYLPLLKNDNNLTYSIHLRVKNFGEHFIGKLLFFLNKRFLRMLLFLKILIARFDVIFIQRTLLSLLELKILKLYKKKIIYDVDDGIFLYNDNMMAKFKNTVRIADKVIVSTPFLKHFLSQYEVNSDIIYSSVDSKKFFRKDPENNNKIVIGWSGSSSTLKYVVDIIDIIINILNKYENTEFHYISSDDKLSHLHARIHFFKWHELSEPEIIRQFNIGIMPIPDDIWSKYKGGYKLFMYLMSDIPVIASPVGINSDIVNHVYNGYLAESPIEWFNYLDNLCKDRDLLNHFRSNVNGMDKSMFDVNSNFPKILNIIKDE